MSRTCTRTSRDRVWPRFVLGLLVFAVWTAGAFASPPSVVPNILPAPTDIVPAGHTVRPIADASTEPLPPAATETAPIPTLTMPAAAPPLDCVDCDPKQDTPGKTWEMLWNNGLYFQTTDRAFVMHIGAFVHYDGAWYTGSEALQSRDSRDGIGGTGRFYDAVNPRRGRIYFDGTIYNNIDYVLQWEFFNGIGFSPVGTQGNVIASSVVNAPGPTDMFVTIKDVPFFGNIRIGNQKEWFSLEHLESVRWIQFMERSFLFDFHQLSAFNNGRSPGISAFRNWADGRVWSGIGFYKNESDLIGFGIGDGQYALTGRLAALPLWNPEEQRYWHVGGAFTHRDPVDDQVQIRIRSDVRNAPFPLLPLLLNTTNVPVSQQQMFNVETAYVDGPLTMQAEYTANVWYGVNTRSDHAGENLGTYLFHGAYGSVMYFLTGEHRTWNQAYYFYNRVIPKKNFAFRKNGLGVEGWGAWEIGARYSYLNVTDQDVKAGMLNAATLGLNWYLNPNLKMQFNYDYTYRTHNGDPEARGAIHAYGMRMAMEF